MSGRTEFKTFLIEAVGANAESNRTHNAATIVAASLAGLLDDDFAMLLFHKATPDERAHPFMACIEQVEYEHDRKTSIGPGGSPEQEMLTFENDWLIANIEKIRLHFIRQLLKEVTAPSCQTA